MKNFSITEVIHVTSHPLWTTAGCVCVCVSVCGLAAMTTTFESRMNGITQEEASRFKSAPEVFEVHRLPGHLQSKSSLLTLARCSAAHAHKLASYIILPKQTSSLSESEAAMLTDG